MMPEFAQRLMESVGWDDAMTILTRWGGMRIYIATTLDGALSSPLTKVIGADKVLKIAREVDSGWVYVPMCSKMLTAQRDKEIIARIEAGDDTREIVTRFRISERQVRRILKESRDGAE